MENLGKHYSFTSLLKKHQIGSKFLANTAYNYSILNVYFLQ